MKRLFFVIMFILLLPALGVPCHAEPAPVGVDIVVDIRHGGTAVIVPRADNPMPEESTLTLRSGQYGVFHIVYTHVGDFWYTVQVQEYNGSAAYDDTVYTLEVFVTEEEGELDATIVVYRDDAKSDPIMVKPSYLHVEEKWVPISFNNIDTTVDDSSGDYVPTSTGTGGQGDPQNPNDPNNPNNSQNPNDPNDPNSSQNPNDPNDPNNPNNSQNPNDPNDPNSPQGSGGSAGTGEPPDGGSGSGSLDTDTAEGGSLTGQPKTGDDSMLLRYLVVAILASAGLFLLSVLYLIDVNRNLKTRAARR